MALVIVNWEVNFYMTQCYMFIYNDMENHLVYYFKMYFKLCVTVYVRICTVEHRDSGFSKARVIMVSFKPHNVSEWK